MAQDYRVIAVKTTGQQDQNGNDMLWLSFEGVKDNALMFAKKHPEAETVEYGNLTTEKSQKSGKEYLRFRRVQREEGQPQQQSFKGSEKKEWQPRDDDRIVAQWAIGQAVSVHPHEWLMQFGTETWVKAVEKHATALYQMVDRVKGSVDVKSASGYEQAKKVAEAIKPDVPPAAAYNDVVTEEIDDRPIDLSEIPF